MRAYSGLPCGNNSLAWAIGALLNKRTHVHHIVGHRWPFHQVGLQQPDPTGKHWWPPLPCYTTPWDIILIEDIASKLVRVPGDPDMIVLAIAEG